MKNLRLKLLAIIIVVALVLGCSFIDYQQPLKVKAESTNDLHTITRISSKIETNPTITVLTHGLGSQSYYWSNRYDFNNGTVLACNGCSLINKMYLKLNGQMTLYVANGDVTETDDEPDIYDFDLIKYSHDDYLNDREGKMVPMLDDVSKHIVVVFDSDDPYSSNDKVYEEFHYILDNISLQYKQLTGVLPRFNLVGHSRGGITNIMYATEHPYNVASIYSMGAPYNGSKLGEIDLLMDAMNYFEDDGNLLPGAASIMDKEGNKVIRDAWNQSVSNYLDANINVVAF